MAAPKNQRDLFAEMYVAGVLADRGFDIFFPYRDKGFDFIITQKDKSGQTTIRPVQVKGKYTESKKRYSKYGFKGRLTQTHPDMILAIPFFEVGATESPPTIIAYAFLNEIIKTHIPAKPGVPGGAGVKPKRPQPAWDRYSCQPAQLTKGIPKPRNDSKHFFDINRI